MPTFVTLAVYVPTSTWPLYIQHWTYTGRWDSIVSKWLGYRLVDLGFTFWNGKEVFFSSSRTSTPALSRTKPPIQCVEGDFSLGVMWPRHETYHSPHSPPNSAAVRMSGTIPSFFLYGICKKKLHFFFLFTKPITWKFSTLLYIVILPAPLMWDISFYKASDYISPTMQSLQQYCICTLEENNFHMYSETIWGPFVISDDKQVNAHFKVVHSEHFLFSIHHFSC